MAFRKGGDQATKAAENQGGGRFARVEYLSIDEGEQEVLRYLTDKDDWIFVDQHASVPTKNKPKDYEGNWPKSMPAVCRYDEAFEGQFKDCYICDQGLTNQWGRPCKPTIRNWALACIREEVVGTKEMAAAGEIEESQIGKRLGFRDAIREIDERDEKGEPTGKVLQERRIVVVNMAPSNYFNGLSAIASAFGGTICNQDFVVKRTGEGKDAVYTHIGLGITENLAPGTERWKKYEESMKAQNIDLVKILSDRASDEFYARFFDETKTVPSKGEGSSKGESSAPEVPKNDDTDVDQDRLAAMRERVRSQGQPAPVGASSSVSDID
jgi:hypothetical protein